MCCVFCVLVLSLFISDVDPSLISRQNELAKAQLGDGIKQHLETRPGLVIDKKLEPDIID